MPSPKISLLLVCCALFVGIVIIGSKFVKNDPKKTGDLGKELSVDIYFKDSNKDSDNDGLLDWEETLWSSNSNEADTDGDGTNDGDEVKANRNPNVKGPNDQYLTPEESILARISTQKVDKNSITTQASALLLSEYAKLKSSGNLTAEQTSALTEQIARAVIDQINLSGAYTEANLIVVSSKKEDLVNYMNQIVQKHNQAIGSASLLNDSQAAALFYKNLASGITKIPVPDIVKTEHLIIANEYYKISEALNYVVKQQQDPMLALAATTIYEKIAENIANTYGQLGTKLAGKGLIYENGTFK